MILLSPTRGVSRTLSNICSGSFLVKLTAKTRSLIWQKSSIIQVLFIRSFDTSVYSSQIEWQPEICKELRKRHVKKYFCSIFILNTTKYKIKNLILGYCLCSVYQSYIQDPHNRPEYQHQTLCNVRQKIELSPTKTASQRTQLFAVEFKKKLQVTHVLKLKRTL